MDSEKEIATERAQVVRLLEASCKIDFPTEQERNFRLALMKKAGVLLNLREVREKEITGPGNPPTTQPTPPKKR